MRQGDWFIAPASAFGRVCSSPSLQVPLSSETAMPFDPSKPANNSPASSAEMRSQLTSLNADIQTRATSAALNGAIAGTSNNSNGVGTLGMSVSDPPQQWEVQQIADKLDELINALRR